MSPVECVPPIFNSDESWFEWSVGSSEAFLALREGDGDLELILFPYDPVLETVLTDVEALEQVEVSFTLERDFRFLDVTVDGERVHRLLTVACSGCTATLLEWHTQGGHPVCDDCLRTAPCEDPSCVLC